MLPCKVHNAIRNEMSHANIFHEDGKEILDISSSPAIVDQQTHFNLTRIDPHNKMASSDSTSRESAHSKNAITNELENKEEFFQLPNWKLSWKLEFLKDCDSFFENE